VTASFPAIAPVWDRAACMPFSDLPTLMRTIGI